MRTEAEITKLRAEHRRECAARGMPCTDCITQDAYGFAPRFAGSSRCESGSIASGGRYPHCTCDVCF